MDDIVRTVRLLVEHANTPCHRVHPSAKITYITEVLFLKLSKNIAPNRFFLLRYYVHSLLGLFAMICIIGAVKENVPWFPNNDIDLFGHLVFLGVVALGGLEALSIGIVLFLGLS